MRTSLSKAMGLVVAVVALHLFVAPIAQAANPGGDACSTGEGKIDGRGSTFQTKTQGNVFIPGFREEVCGPARVPLSNPPVPDNYLQWYNYPSSSAIQGSTNGLRAVSCRTDAYAGTDSPYTTAQLNQLKGVKGAIGGCPDDSFVPPYRPFGNTPPGRWPAAGKDNVNPLTVPVTMGAVALGYWIRTRTCLPDPVPSVINLTKGDVSGILGGDIRIWNDPRLVADNPGLANCNVPITRVVRLDGSGTTQTVKTYLVNQGPGRIAGATCVPGSNWTTFAGNGSNWPYDGTFVGDDGQATATCSAISRRSGTSGVRDRCKGVPGAFCYMDAADIVSADAGQIRMAAVRNSTDTAFAGALGPNPHTGLSTQSNCESTTNTLPGSTDSDSVGLNAVDTWASDNTSGFHGDATFQGTKYPICAFSWMVFYSGLSNTAPGASAIDELSLNQRQTLYSLSQYAVSVSGQERLRTQYYAPIPLPWLPKLTVGIQSNF